MAVAASRTLVFRLSSLGDVILALAAASGLGPGGRVDWVVAREYAGLLQGHPGIGRVWAFDRGSGLRGWTRLCGELWREDYGGILDLHGSLRTLVARALFAAWSIRARTRGPRWARAPKHRVRYWGYYVFKALWPSRLRPEPRVRLFAAAGGGDPSRKPDLSHLAAGAAPTGAPGPDRGAYVCVMPGSRWKGKQWAPERFAAVLAGLSREKRLFPVVMGGPGDRISVELVRELERLGVPHGSGIGRWNLAETAKVLAGARAYFGADTGLAHLAEAVGSPAWIVYGPTVEDMGFGPWRGGSLALGSKLWCRPCSKDGRGCHRILRRHLCLKGLKAADVESRIGNHLR